MTLVLGADGRPKTLRVNGTGSATGLNDLGDPGSALSEVDLREFAIDRDLSAGQDRSSSAPSSTCATPTCRAAALDVLRSGSIGEAGETGLDLARLLVDEAQIEYGVYDTTQAR